MNEFDIINVLKKKNINNNNIILGIGDDAACFRVPNGYQVLVSSDTLVSDVHFYHYWNPYHIAYKAVMVNISDIIAMSGIPCWILLSITMPEINFLWINQFSNGLYKALYKYNMSLIGGDVTKGPLSITITIHGLIKKNKVITRSGALPGDIIYVSGKLGASALAVNIQNKKNNNIHININHKDMDFLINKLQFPHPRLDLVEILQKFSSAAIDISDGLSSDLNHICNSSKVGACIIKENIPIHRLVYKYNKKNALQYALHGGEDYELCFTVPIQKEKRFLHNIKKKKIHCYKIGYITKMLGIRIIYNKNVNVVIPNGYKHF